MPEKWHGLNPEAVLETVTHYTSLYNKSEEIMAKDKNICLHHHVLGKANKLQYSVSSIRLECLKILLYDD
jgi:hypothetical protein